MGNWVIIYRCCWKCKLHNHMEGKLAMSSTTKAIPLLGIQPEDKPPKIKTNLCHRLFIVSFQIILSLASDILLNCMLLKCVVLKLSGLLSVYSSLTAVCDRPLELLDSVSPILGTGGIPSGFSFPMLWSRNSLKGQLQSSLFLFYRDCSLSFSTPDINCLKLIVPYIFV